MYYNIYGLPKFSECEVFVSGIPTQGGNRSETRSVTFETDPDG
jgi:hypothetical protein